MRGLVISRTPLRVSFAGGGTDLHAFYTREGGAVVGSAIDKFVYVVVRPLERVHPFRLRFAHDAVETAASVGELKQPIMRGALEAVGIAEDLDIATFCDVPRGTGLGSSGSFIVGLLHALYRFVGRSIDPEELAAESCALEAAQFGSHGGKQDQYFAAYGGVRFFEFLPDERVVAHSLPLGVADKRLLEESLMLVFSGQTRRADSILKKQERLIEDRSDTLREMKYLAAELRDHLLGDARVDALGRILHRDWSLKRQLAPGITNEAIDQLYETALGAGALGGKVLGAGGGGFVLLCVPPERREAVKRALHGFQLTGLSFHAAGSEVWETR